MALCALTNKAFSHQHSHTAGTNRAAGRRAASLCLQAKRNGAQPQQPSMKEDWYAATKARPRTVREELEYRRAANLAANNGKERKDLYTDQWDGAVYKGSRWNILTFLAALFVLVPVGGLVFAFWSYGDLWG